MYHEMPVVFPGAGNLFLEVKNGKIEMRALQ